MGLGRFLWRATGIGHRIDTVKNIVEEGSIVKGVKKTIKEDNRRDYVTKKKSIKGSEVLWR